jgi:hypothetical protein
VPNVTVNTSAPAYTTRHQQFQEIVTFWKPILQVYAQLEGEERDAWRENDPFLNDLIRFTEKVQGFKEDVS